MNPVRKLPRKAFVDQKSCVACGCCAKVCPMDAIQIFHGIMARVDMGKCVGCGRGQLLGLLGGRFGLSRKKDIPGWMKSRWFRYGFLAFFLVMFMQMLFNTALVFSRVRDLTQAVTLLWTFQVPWHWAYHGTRLHAGAAQFAFGFYSVMLTSTILGLVTMVLFKPRSWCVYCPMGTMTQLICQAKHRT